MNRLFNSMLLVAGFGLLLTPILAADVSETERRRLDAARNAHTQELERAAVNYRAAVARANANVERAYQNVIQAYERRGDNDTAAALRAEMELAVASSDELPEGVEPGHTRLIEAIGPTLVGPNGAVPAASLADKQYVMLYFSAAWCGPCRAFTPSLVEFYNAHRPGGRFELVFVSSDRSAAEMQKYMSDYQMAFPAVPFNRIQPSGIRQTYGGRGIPNLLILDREGNVVSGSYEGENYVGPRKVLADMQRLLAAPTEQAAAN